METVVESLCCREVSAFWSLVEGLTFMSHEMCFSNATLIMTVVGGVHVMGLANVQLVNISLRLTVASSCLRRAAPSFSVLLGLGPGQAERCVCTDGTAVGISRAYKYLYLALSLYLYM